MTDPKSTTSGNKKKNKRTLIIGLILFAIFLALFGWNIYHDHFADKEEPPTSGVTATVNEAGETELEYDIVEYIKFPGYNDTTFTKPEQKMKLYNPIENGVYFIFSAKDPLTGEVIWESEKVYPGENLDWDIQSHFEKGSHAINLVIKTFHVQSEMAMNGLNEVFNFTIE